MCLMPDEVLSSCLTFIVSFWVVTLYYLVGSYQCFGECITSIYTTNVTIQKAINDIFNQITIA